MRMSFLLLLLFSNAKVPYIRVGCTEPHQPEKIKKKRRKKGASKGAKDE
jgi:hypothetical protein